MPDRARSSAFSAHDWVERMIRPLPRGGAILDLGCGGGEPIDRYLIDHGFRITGVDAAQTQIDLARTRFPRQRWINADMRAVLVDEQFDAVIAWGSLSRFGDTDQRLMLMRMADWLKRGGRLLVNKDDSADVDAATYSAAITRNGLIEMAHVVQDPPLGGAGVWLARKP